MFNSKSSILLIALGSIIVLAGIAMYIFNIAGAMGMIFMGALVEGAGMFFYIKNKRSK